MPPKPKSRPRPSETIRDFVLFLGKEGYEFGRRDQDGSQLIPADINLRRAITKFLGLNDSLLREDIKSLVLAYNMNFGEFDE